MSDFFSPAPAIPPLQPALARAYARRVAASRKLLALQGFAVLLAVISVAIFILGFRQAARDAEKFDDCRTEWEGKLEALQEIRDAQEHGRMVSGGAYSLGRMLSERPQLWQDHARIQRLLKEASGPEDEYDNRPPSPPTEATARATAELAIAVRAELDHPTPTLVERYGGPLVEWMLLLLGLGIVLSLRMSALISALQPSPSKTPWLGNSDPWAPDLSVFRFAVWAVPALHALTILGALYCYAAAYPPEDQDKAFSLHLTIYDCQTSLTEELKLWNDLIKAGTEAGAAAAADLRARLTHRQSATEALIAKMKLEAAEKGDPLWTQATQDLATAYATQLTPLYTQSPARAIPYNIIQSVNLPIERMQNKLWEMLTNGSPRLFMLFAALPILFLVGIPCGASLLLLFVAVIATLGLNSRAEVKTFAASSAS